ncbi:hypothetical protein SUH3_17100 [Pseudosulfitobacter pseudonitzschiae]|uniref:Uncharacterized protein n=1 Tax=Pseudosulfitobacter pseudonitzschiae TaxID=1402135 RepID=A0A073J1X2_9RHOB|nr:hypothetical protein SUH3_17100 [Pseudosulfitobacter pseudonitzschiae]
MHQFGDKRNPKGNATLNALTSAGAVLIFGGMIALSASLSDGRAKNHPCMSQQDITWHQDRSRNGVSLTCTQDIMLRNQRENGER